MADSIRTVDDLIGALSQYAGDWPVKFEHVTAEEWASGEDAEYDYTVDAVVLDLDTDTVRLLSIGDNLDQ